MGKKKINNKNLEKTYKHLILVPLHLQVLNTQTNIYIK
jgi:hypothetical protein